METYRSDSVFLGVGYFYKSVWRSPLYPSNITKPYRTNYRIAEVFLALITFGSNYEAKSNLVKALKALNQQVQILAVSPVYENPAISKTTATPYLNGACLVKTSLQALELHEQVLRPIEDSLGRIRGEEGKVKCSIDLDLVLYDKQILSTPDLQLPAPDILQYAYVALPLGFLVPDWIHPITKQTMAEIANRFFQQKATFYHQVEVNEAIGASLRQRQGRTLLRFALRS
ncbi:MAG: 2-amino-4-hydroxy-6-hydroxymethyldihydropteridine diphosphokinase [Tolypothrix carrinoi HA7290-LM1]|nr:2-amino-4-hydroxy-6-hydroxymethyldihydropteridine diphosphokinase [Tolypothrix carrinoi HA7290-LM1]